ncbi:MAG: excinuclease ABC subunit UvrA [Chitinophagaceae bacterium]
MSATVKKPSVSRKDTQEDTVSSIYVKGARTHNLQNVSVGIPRNKFTVVTGVSGSGKSSLTIDTLFAEGQRRYAESLSAYARQFLSRMPAPDVDYIKGLCPAIAIEQKVITRTPRSTVGSMTEIYDYLRLLFARIGHTVSPVSGREVRKDDVTDIVRHITAQPAQSKIFLLAKFKLQHNREILEELNILVQKGFARIFIFDKKNSETLLIEDLLEEKESALKKKLKKDQTFILVDRLVKKDFDEDELHRIADSANTAFFEGEGEVYVVTDNGEPTHFSNRFELDGIRFEEPVPNLFSFNNPYGACPTCEGFGHVLGIDPELVIPDKRLSIYEGAVAPWKGEKMVWWKDQFVKGAASFKFPIHKAFADLTDEQVQQLWQGNQYVQGINDFFDDIEAHLYKIQNRVLLSRYRGRTPCPDCHGYRLRKEALYVRINGKHIGELSTMPTKDLLTWLQALQLNQSETKIANRLMTEIQQRLQTLIDVGLGYLTLNRLANTLSGGESQRIQLTRSLGSTLTDSLYILDEPSIGLHSRDTENLIKVLKRLRDLHNTVVVVEHDEMIMHQSDHIIDMGPLAAHLGGKVIAEGNYDSIVKNPESLTGQYLSGKLSIEPPKKVRGWNKSITIEGARHNNLKNITVQFPLNVLCAVTGVSGSGKTTLVKQILYPGLMKMKEGTSESVGFHKAITGDIKSITHIELVDQNPIGKSSRSNPVTYIKAYDEIRNLYARQPLSKIRGFQAKHFSFNVDGGRCDACKGEGEQVVEMQFLTDVHLTCEVCNGKRFKEEVLEVQYKGKSIYDILELSVDEALELFKDEKNIQKAIQPLQDVGLGYIKLGQSSDTLSGGEAQRVKLASFLGQGQKAGHILFIFDEPTTGLHFNDIKKLLSSFNALINQGHSIIVIEHNTDVIRSADWVIDLGPEAGADGGNLVFAGTPQALKKCKESYTGRYL